MKLFIGQVPNHFNEEDVGFRLFCRTEPFSPRVPGNHRLFCTADSQGVRTVRPDCGR